MRLVHQDLPNQSQEFLQKSLRAHSEVIQISLKEKAQPEVLLILGMEIIAQKEVQPEEAKVHLLEIRQEVLQEEVRQEALQEEVRQEALQEEVRQEVLQEEVHQEVLQEEVHQEVLHGEVHQEALQEEVHLEATIAEDHLHQEDHLQEVVQQEALQEVQVQELHQKEEENKTLRVYRFEKGGHFTYLSTFFLQLPDNQL